MEAHSRGGLGLGTGMSLVLLAASDTCADFLSSHFSHLQKSKRKQFLLASARGSLKSPKPRDSGTSIWGAVGGFPGRPPGVLPEAGEASPWSTSPTEGQSGARAVMWELLLQQPWEEGS